MIISTTFEIPGKKVKEILGIVEGSVVRARHIGRDIGAALKSLIGGEIASYTQLLEQSRKDAMERMISQAKELNADAVIGVRFNTSSVMQGASEILVYGTAVKL